jgi:hypothetical protein
MRAFALAAALILCKSAPSSGQVPPPTAESTDTLAGAGRRAGDLQAREPGVTGSFISGFLGGAFLGMGGGAVMLDSKTQVPWIFAGAGVGVIATTISSAGVRSPLPPPVERAVQPQTPQYQSAFRSAYFLRLKQRRQRASVWGAVTGTAAGSALVLWVLANWMET